jgi:hypothetical protein
MPLGHFLLEKSEAGLSERCGQGISDFQCRLVAYLSGPPNHFANLAVTGAKLR